MASSISEINNTEVRSETSHNSEPLAILFLRMLTGLSSLILSKILSASS